MKFSTLTASCITIASIVFSTGFAPAQAELEKALDVPATTQTTNGQAIFTFTNTYMTRRNASDIHTIQPFNLVYLAYQGNLQSQGIPGGNDLIIQHQKHNISAKDVVKAAVYAKKIPNQMLQDKRYLSLVDGYLLSLGKTQ